MVLIAYWRELIIICLVILCGFLGLRLQTAQYNEKETQLIHERLIAEANAKSANIVATVNEQRKIDAELYAIEINHINSKYNDALAKSNRVQSEVTTYNTRLHTVTREALENYAKTGATLYGECRKEYLELGRYANQVDAELDKTTKSPN